MNIQNLKADLHHLIDNTNEESILKAIKTILLKQNESSTDWADDLSDTLRSELEESISEADEGKTISHEEAMKRIKSRYNL